ncbi:hypothetical protein [Nesterenkonia jeotgali]|uniref:Uncharacterized protein n=1 Tax=Nesterenkonia jeotgali TaxID=317018 RepID=A0A839FTN8_9MICC|nr:hypothetical protein [Nesterenkonia jeotgali]MBA8920454.1 hypothetical protein [Nesterenkonia jeotgali]
METWTTAYRFEWTPIIAFSARRLELLQWLQDNVEPVAFRDQDDSVGVAVEDLYLKVTATRDSLTLLNGRVPHLDLEATTHVVEGIFETLKPEGITLAYSSQAISGELPSADYEAETARFSARAAGTPDVSVVPYDAAILADFSTPGFLVQSEWGIVNGSELAMRVEDPRVGRAGGSRALTSLDNEDRQSLPALSVFMDNFIRPSTKGEINDVQSLFGTARSADEASELVSSTIMEGMR